MLLKLLALTAILSLVFPSAGITGPQSPPDLSGIYAVATELVDRETEAKTLHHGAALIRKKGDVYIVEICGIGTTVGIGRLEGDKFIIAWKQGGSIGLTVYQHKKDKLIGSWTSLPGDGELHEETLTFIQALPSAKKAATGINEVSR